MESKFIEAAHSPDGGNWGKFAVCRWTEQEWRRRSAVDTGRSLLAGRGRSPADIWVLDLETGEGAWLYPGGSASADLNRHQVLVCPLFEPFLAWLYEQDLTDVQALPGVVYLPDAEFSPAGYRRQGPLARALREMFGLVN